MSRSSWAPVRDPRLKPCPFCGAPAEYSRFGTVHFVRCSAVFCRAEIGQEMGIPGGTKRGVFAAWNRRENP